MEHLSKQLEKINISNEIDCSSDLRDNVCASPNKIFNIEDTGVSDSNTTIPKDHVQIENNPSLYRKPTCKHGLKCFNADCKCDHPSGWSPCQNGPYCTDFYCNAQHPYDRTRLCRFEGRCKELKCKFLHPNGRIGECHAGNHCRIWKCPARHPDTRPKECPFGEICYNSVCQRLHPPTRQLCPKGSECPEYYCRFNHSADRKAKCNEGNFCGNVYCAELHPPEWNTRETGSNCTDASCLYTSHPDDRILQETQLSNSKVMKSIEERQIERQKAQLPILNVKDEFCRKLKEERAILITAETGSGKSTQLPQYAAEYFRGLIVCTQPRVLATMSLAKRVAKEYDGISPGRSVGHRVGYANIGKNQYRIPGTDILFVTDAALIQENQANNLLHDTKVLIIDEAHERTVYTDIVIGMAKFLLNARPSDFYIVISSATVDPSKFLDFLKLTKDSVLNVPGRLHNVSLRYIPALKVPIVAHTIATLLNVYDQWQGHILVFLSGAQEIQQAIALFNQKLPDNCIALPLYATLSLEEQNKVLHFDDGCNRNLRMVIFCTNIAETSVTINNVCVVIDSGLAKEPRFDSKRRLTIIETVRISRSSADQRKGCADRTAAGHSIRLYNDDELVRTNIESAILRSSLDFVVLQIEYLDLNINEFPFIDPPDPAVIETSLNLLKQLSCFDSDGKITQRGLLFNELCFYPCYSAFLVDTYLKHGPILDLLAIIVPILVTSGFRADMIGALPEDKKAAKNHVVNGAKNYDSDLLYLVSMFKNCQSSGSIDPETGICRICHTNLIKESSCAVCRAAYSNMYLLNNRNLCVIDNIHQMIKTILTNPRWQLCPGLLANSNEDEILGYSLFKHFPEKYGRILPYRTAKKDARMIQNNFDAKFSESSIYSHRKIVNPHFIAMSVVKLPSGIHLIDQLHPLRPPSKEKQQPITTNDEYTVE